MMDTGIEKLITAWQKRNIAAFYCQDKTSAINKILGMIPLSASIGISGSVTLDQLGIVKRLEERGNQVFNQYKSGMSREENLALRRKGSQADYYLTSANAISEKGELVFLSGYGNRTAGIAYAKNVIVVCGINKITANLDAALRRSREYATPLNIKRLNWDAAKPMICQVLIVEAEVAPERLKVILVGESLGF